ncbi:PiggyBac transposable element-derived protein 1 [Dictyocoela muelleri]|nr:PiggyBac transposable element-derived protein 1 [Dictyocoela muelleri]
MKKFIGIVMCMGLVRAPKIDNYWSKKEIYNYSFIRSHMSRDRFQLLLNLLHFNDNEVIDRQNKLHKIQPLIDRFLRAAYQCTHQDQVLSLTNLSFLSEGEYLLGNTFPGKPINME